MSVDTRRKFRDEALSEEPAERSSVRRDRIVGRTESPTRPPPALPTHPFASGTIAFIYEHRRETSDGTADHTRRTRRLPAFLPNPSQVPHRRARRPSVRPFGLLHRSLRFRNTRPLRGVSADSDVLPCTSSSDNRTFHVREAVPLSSELPTGNSTIRPAAGLFDGRRRHSRRPVRHCAGPFPCPPGGTMFLQRVGRGLRHRKSDAAGRRAGWPQRRSLPLRRVFGRIVAEAVPRFGKNSLLCVH